MANLRTHAADARPSAGRAGDVRRHALFHAQDAQGQLPAQGGGGACGEPGGGACAGLPLAYGKAAICLIELVNWGTSRACAYRSRGVLLTPRRTPKVLPGSSYGT